jgi:hypothetical protein
MLYKWLPGKQPLHEGCERKHLWSKILFWHLFGDNEEDHKNLSKTSQSLAGQACLVEKFLACGRNNPINYNDKFYTWTWKWKSGWWWCAMRQNTGERSPRTTRHGKNQTLLLQIAHHYWSCLYMVSYKFSQLLKGTLVLFLQLTGHYIFLKRRIQPSGNLKINLSLSTFMST